MAERKPLAQGGLPPFFDHRIDELLELEKRRLELEHGLYYSTGVYNETLKAGRELILFWGFGEWKLRHTVARVKLPDATIPEVYFVIYQDGYVTEDDSPYEYNANYLKSPNDFGWVTLYDDTNYRYIWIVPWNISSREELGVILRNDTRVDITVEYATVELLVRPYARYMIKSKGAGWG